jgi:hypothetical protein
MSSLICCAEDIPINPTALWGAGISLGQRTAAA